VTRILAWPLVLTLSAAAAVTLELAHVHGIARIVVGFWFLFVCPGMALVRLLRLTDRLGELVVAVGASLALEMILATVALYAGVWSPLGLLVILATLAVVGAAAQVRQELHAATATGSST
jgi:uncharacterized membrane protein